MKIGQGVDAHRFGELRAETTIRLGGVDVLSDRPIIAHSDGDVLLHALCDALLGGIGRDDIGEQFPDTDPEFQDIDSRELVSRCMELVKAAGYGIVNVDLTLIAATPRISPYRQQMKDAIAQVLKIDVAQINLKATTTEGMGFTGRGEGVAAMGIVLLEAI